MSSLRGCLKSLFTVGDLWYDRGMEPRKPYPTDLTDREWELIQPYVPEAKPGGRPEKYPKREILNGIFDILRGGCAWRLLPHDFPPVADGLPVLLALAAGRDLAGDARPAPR